MTSTRTDTDSVNFDRISKAIEYIIENFKDQPQLEEIAEVCHLSPFHFQRLFKDWAGVSPKKFLQYITIEHAKNLIVQEQTNLFDTSVQSGLSGTSRLHDLFISIEGMTPGEYKLGGKNLMIDYSFSMTPFGEVLIASTKKGISSISFIENRDKSLAGLTKLFPNADLNERQNNMHKTVSETISRVEFKPERLKLHLKGTAFQLKVWEALLTIPFGKLATYGDIAVRIDQPGAARAVGSAIGRNPVAYLIPCHRVIRATGVIGGYRWGSLRKKIIIGWESSVTENMLK